MSASSPVIIDEKNSDQHELNIVREEQDPLLHQPPRVMDASLVKTTPANGEQQANSEETNRIIIGQKSRIVEPEVAYRARGISCDFSIQKAAEAIRHQTGLEVSELKKIWMRKGSRFIPGYRDVYFMCKASEAFKVDRVKQITFGSETSTICRVSGVFTTGLEGTEHNPKNRDDLCNFCTFCGRKVKHILGSRACRRRASKRQKKLENLARGTVNPKREKKEQNDAAKSGSIV